MTRTKIVYEQEWAQSEPLAESSRKSLKRNQKQEYYSFKKKHMKKSPPSFCCYQYYKFIVLIFLIIVLLPLTFSAFSRQLNNMDEQIDNESQDQNFYGFKNIKTQTVPSLHNKAQTPEEQSHKYQAMRITKQPMKVQQNKIKQSAAQVKPQTGTASTASIASIASRAGITAGQVTQAKQFLKLKDLPKDDPLAQKQYEYYESKYKISTYQELPICIVVPTFNNAKDNRHFHNMDSILQQNYSNYHIVFIDDASNDTTATDMKKYFEQKNIKEPKLLFIQNSERKMAMPNLLMAAKSYCKPEEIFIIVDGDDELLGRQVLKHFNAVFQSKKVWVMYSNFLASRGSVGYSRPFSQATIQRNAYRRSGFVISHLRAFYTKLFVLIHQEDLKDASGNFFKAANDVAICLPILQMSHEKIIYSPQLSYYYNSNTGLNNHRVRLKQQKDNEKYIRKKKTYQALKQLFPENSSPSTLNNAQTSNMNAQNNIRQQKVAASSDIRQ